MSSGAANSANYALSQCVGVPQTLKASYASSGGAGKYYPHLAAELTAVLAPR